MKAIISSIAIFFIATFGVTAFAVDPLNIGYIPGGITKGNTVQLKVPIDQLDTIQGHFLQSGKILYRIDDTMCRDGNVVLELSPTIAGRVTSASFLKSFNNVKLPYKKKLICNPLTQ